MAVVVEEEEGEGRVRWGTWEELVLGGAVIRHGARDWDAVASEVQARTLYPFVFTPQACKAKYEDLQQRYSGCTAWFEELRKLRVEELKRSLEKSEDSIGSLESKLESLKAEKLGFSNAEYSSSRTESPQAPHQKSEGNEFSGRETSKDGSSAGSFIQQTPRNQSPECGVVALAEQNEQKPAFLNLMVETICLERGFCTRKRRGKRKRKEWSREVKEGSVGENNLLGEVVATIALTGKENQYCVSGKGASLKDGSDGLMGILDSLMENEHANVFQRRLDSQKRARYRKTVCQHMDLNMIRSRIITNSITTPLELFRDLLLLANNVLVFYSKNTRERKCAFILRNLVTKTLSQHQNATCTEPTEPARPSSPTPKQPAKPRSSRPFNHKSTSKPPKAENFAAGAAKEVKNPPKNVDSPSSVESSVQTKRSNGGRGKASRVKRGSSTSGLGNETRMKVRKKARAR